MELDRIFDQRRVSSINVHQVFVDRTSCFENFDKTLEYMQEGRLPAALAPPQRCNVLVYYGIGGIGKSALSKQLEERFRTSTNKRGVKGLTCGINLDDPALMELENVILLIRSALGEGVRSWPAFDLAFATYWERRHPNISLKKFIERDSALKQMSGSLGLAKQLDETLDSLFGPVPFAGIARRAVTTLGVKLRDKMRRDQLLADCPGFEQIVETDSTQEILQFLPALISWDLAEHQRRQSIEVTIFLDTFERVDELRREPGGVEDSFVRMAYLLPNVLFVITGRNRLTWGDRHSAVIHYSGPNYWPALTTEPPRHFMPMQHRLTGLDEANARSYLELRLTRNGQPAIPPNIREKIVAASGGAPIYLELSAEYFDQLTTGQEPPRVECFGAPFSEMVTRIMRDLTTQERSLLRSAALVDRFDAALLRAAAPESRDTTIGSFVTRPIVQFEELGWLRYSVDEYIRNAVRRRDGDTDDPWSEEEWKSASTRMLDNLRERLTEDIKNPTTADRTRLIQGFTTAGMLALRTGQVPDWLYEMIYALRLHHLTAALSATEIWSPPAGHPLEAFILTCHGDARRILGDRSGSVALLERASIHPALTPHARLFVTHRLAKALEEVGRYADAESLIAQVATTSSSLQETARKDLAWIRWIRGDGKQLLEWSLHHRISPVGFHRAQALDLLGQFYFTQGDFTAAETCFRELVNDPELETGQILRDTGSRNLAMVVSWIRPLEAEPLLDRAFQVNQAASVLVGLAQIHIFRGVSRVGRAPVSEVQRLIDHGECLLRQTQGSADQWMVLFARLFLAAVEGTIQEVRSAADALINHLGEQGCHPGLAEVAARWLALRDTQTGLPLPPLREYWPNRVDGLDSWERVLRERINSSYRQRGER